MSSSCGWIHGFKLTSAHWRVAWICPADSRNRWRSFFRLAGYHPRSQLQSWHWLFKPDHTQKKKERAWHKVSQRVYFLLRTNPKLSVIRVHESVLVYHEPTQDSLEEMCHMITFFRLTLAVPDFTFSAAANLRFFRDDCAIRSSSRAGSKCSAHAVDVRTWLAESGEQILQQLELI